MNKKPWLKLKALRIEHQLTQEDMGNILQIHESTYNRKELGITDFTLAEAIKISKRFNKSLDEIFFKNQVNANETKVS